MSNEVVNFLKMYILFVGIINMVYGVIAVIISCKEKDYKLPIKFLMLVIATILVMLWAGVIG